MAELQTPIAPPAEPAAPQAPAPGKGSAEQKLKKNKKPRKVRTIVGLAILAAIVVAVVVLLKVFLFSEGKKEILTDIASISSIQSMVEGSGTTKAKDSATITLTTGGTVQEVFVHEGDQVMEGQPLYVIDSSEAQKAVEDAQKSYDNLQKQLKGLYDAINDLTVTAPFSGKLLEVAEINVGEDVGTGTKLATLVDDSAMKLSLYFSYAYENSVSVGQTASVSIPATMSQLSGKVVEINKVRYVSPEGSVFFEVVLEVPNTSGTLTADMEATASLTVNGETAYPYNGGKLSYKRTKDIVTKVGGECLSVNLNNYADVKAGATLLKMSGEDNDEQIAALESQMETAAENLKKAQDNLQNFNAVAPISGTVLSCGLVQGEKVENGTTAIVIADTTTMTVDIQVDERNISYVRPGMEITINQYESTYMGVVESVSMTATGENGVAYFPAVVKVDNPDGMLMSGMYVQYSMVASQSDNCLVVPIACVKNVADSEGNPVTVVYLKSGSRPENAVEMPPEAEIPSGFYAVPVETGLYDTMNVEILSGLNEGDEVFTNYMTQQADSYQGY